MIRFFSEYLDFQALLNYLDRFSNLNRTFVFDTITLDVHI